MSGVDESKMKDCIADNIELPIISEDPKTSCADCNPVGIPPETRKGTLQGFTRWGTIRF